MLSAEEQSLSPPSATLLSADISSVGKSQHGLSRAVCGQWLDQVSAALRHTAEHSQQKPAFVYTYGKL